jgi:thiamine biosynthesis lipoprotein
MEKAKNAVDHTRIKLTGDSVFIAAGMKVDLGGIVQGFAADRAGEILRARGVRSAIINIAGEILALGRPPLGRPWRVGIKDPRADGVIESVDLEDGALSTSGDYEKYFELNGRRYAHIIDPRTGYPARDLASVTVFASSAAFADAMATAVAVMGPESGKKFLDSLCIRGIMYYEKDGMLERIAAP